jgi:hypothetical protein
MAGTILFPHFFLLSGGSTYDFNKQQMQVLCQRTKHRNSVKMKHFPLFQKQYQLPI